MWLGLRRISSLRNIRCNSTLARETAERLGNDGRSLSSRESRLLPETLRGRTYRPTLTLNPDVAQAVNNNITALHLPNNLRRVAKNQFLALKENKLHQVPHTDLEIDAHIATFFLHDYGSIFQVLTDLKNNYGLDFQPKNVLDVSMGPATGIIAFNDVMGPEYRCNKDSVILSGVDMQKRAKIMLSRQYNEVSDELVKKESERSDETSDDLQDNIEEGNDLVGEVMTKKIKIQTKLKSFLPIGKQYDLIIISHQLLQHERKFPMEVDQNIEKYLKLLSPGGRIVIVERGTPLGFETVARARQIMIRPERYPDEYGKIPRPWIGGSSIQQSSSSTAEDGETSAEIANQSECDYHLKVIAPCPHHRACPIQTMNPNFYTLKEGGKLKFCSFEKAIKRPKFSLELKKGKLLANKWDEHDVEMTNRKQNMKLAGSGRRNGNDYELIHFSYLVAERSMNDKQTIANINEARKNSASEASKYEIGSLGNGTPLEWPRIINHPTKRKGHIILHLCGSSGNVEKWIIPKSFSKEIYHDAKKAYKGDLWGLDAKTKMATRSEINFEKFKKLEKKRAQIAKKEKRAEEREMTKRFNKITEDEQTNNVDINNMKEVSEVYGHYYNRRGKL